MPSSRKTVSLGGRLSVPALPPGAIDATRERLIHALERGSVGIEAGARRIADPFDVLRARGALDREPGRNDLLWRAGERWRQHWHAGRHEGWSTLDLARPSVDGGSRGAGVTPTESVLRHRDAFHRAEEAIGARLRPFLVGLVIEGRTVAHLAEAVAEAGHKRTAEAIVVERLREGLHRLIDHWGLDGGRRRSAHHLAGVEQA